MRLTRSDRATRIARYVCEACDIELSDMLSGLRHERCVRARRMAAYCIRRSLRYGWHDISAFAGYSSHTSVLQANAAAERMTDPEHEDYDEEFTVTCEAIIQRARIDTKNEQMRHVGGIGARCPKCQQLT